MSKKYSIFSRTFLVVVVTFVPAVAYANPVVAPLMMVWPLTLFLLIPIISVEAIYTQHRLHMGFGRSIYVIGIANILSFLAGIPIAIPFSALMLRGWALIVAAALLLCACFLVSWWVEAKWVLHHMRVTKIGDGRDTGAVWNTIRNANLISYSFVSFVVVLMLLQ